MEKLNDLKALLQHEVQDLVSAEDQIIESMPLMIAKVQNED
jgi:ferritin-like metal-binding protein YciE